MILFTIGKYNVTEGSFFGNISNVVWQVSDQTCESITTLFGKNIGDRVGWMCWSG